MIRSMAKAGLWTGRVKLFVLSELAGPSGLKITVFSSVQAPKRLRIFWEFWNRYLLFIEYHKYTYVHKLIQALVIHDFLSCSESIMFE